MAKKRSYRRKTLLERFLRSFIKAGENECWNWSKFLDRDGYGQMTVRPENGEEGDVVTKRSHRLAYVLLVGEIPEGKSVCHKCDNPSCVNPNHLFLGTQLENMQDKVRKGRQPVGDKHHSSNLSEEDVLEIKRLVFSGISQAEVGRRFNIAHQHISRISSCKSWSHLSVVHDSAA